MDAVPARTPADSAPLIREFPGATTCVVIGRAGAATLELRRYRAALWCVAGPEPGGNLHRTATQVVCLEADDLDDRILQFLRLDARRLPTLVVLPDALEESSAVYTAAVARVSAMLEAQHRARVTRQQDGFVWQRNVLANLNAYAQRPLPLAWKNALAGLPAAICGAGPSLDISAPRLAAAQENCVVLAADSSLRTLARHGVRVDFAVSVDVAKVPEKCLPETGELPTRVILSPVSPAGWGERLAATQLHFVSSRQITLDWLAQSGVAAPALGVAENCGVTALELARWLGCGPIFLFGLDLALSGAQRHTAAVESSIYAQSGFNAAQSYPEVPGNWSERVSTHAIGDWRAVNRRLASFGAGTVFNVNDRGARLENAAVVRPEEWSAPAASIAKTTRLQRLSAEGVASRDERAWAAVTAELHAAGRKLHAALPTLRRGLESRGPESAVAGLRPLLAEPAIGRALGGFALKLMPHLLPPTEGDADFWRGLLDEAEQLAHALLAVR